MKKKKSYNDDPVYYCKRCLSLNIRKNPFLKDTDYCADCGTTEIETTTIDEWNKMYEKKYGHPFIVKKELKWPYWC